MRAKWVLNRTRKKLIPTAVPGSEAGTHSSSPAGLQRIGPRKASQMAPDVFQSAAEKFTEIRTSTLATAPDQTGYVYDFSMAKLALAAWVVSASSDPRVSEAACAASASP